MSVPYPLNTLNTSRAGSRVPSRNPSALHLPVIRALPPRIPPPSYRHAAPCGPWPWIDLESEMSSTSPDMSASDTLDGLRSARSSRSLAVPHLPRNAASVKDISENPEREAWAGYPRSLFPNWTEDQLKRSHITDALQEHKGSRPCAIHHVDVGEDGHFSVPKTHVIGRGDADEFWDKMHIKRKAKTRVRALFVENLSGPVLQMLGTKYNIEPFFFSSSLNWIPSRYQENVQPGQGDHITVTLTFLRVMQENTVPISPDSAPIAIEHAIDTQGPLVLRSTGKVLLLDLLSVHMIRAPDGGSTIISFHPGEEWCTTTAQQLHTRVRYAGQSVFWQNIFKKASDPTLVLLAILWHALYAWDEAMEELYEHICWLESRVIHTSDIRFTQELHIISAHILHYSSLLGDFRKTVTFISDTPNPALDHPEHDTVDREASHEVMQRECKNLLDQIERMELSCGMHGKRLQNVMNLVFSTVNIEDSKHMRSLTEATVRDSAAMKQISYLTMIFLPASFVASAFGMNVKELSSDTNGTIAHYIETVIPLTLVTIWIIVALRGKHPTDGDDGEEEMSIWGRLWWPARMMREAFEAQMERYRDVTVRMRRVRKKDTVQWSEEV